MPSGNVIQSRSCKMWAIMFTLILVGFALCIAGNQMAHDAHHANLAENPLQSASAITTICGGAVILFTHIAQMVFHTRFQHEMIEHANETADSFPMPSSPCKDPKRLGNRTKLIVEQKMSKSLRENWKYNILLAALTIGAIGGSYGLSTGGCGTGIGITLFGLLSIWQFGNCAQTYYAMRGANNLIFKAEGKALERWNRYEPDHQPEATANQERGVETNTTTGDERRNANQTNTTTGDERRNANQTNTTTGDERRNGILFVQNMVKEGILDETSQNRSTKAVASPDAAEMAAAKTGVLFLS